MSLPDIINASFEFGAGLAVLHHCFKLHEHKQSRGVSIPAVLFFTVWGLWNLFYYPHLGQFWSFAGGLFITLVNMAYLGMLIHYAPSNAWLALADATPTIGERCELITDGGDRFKGIYVGDRSFYRCGAIVADTVLWRRTAS